MGAFSFSKQLLDVIEWNDARENQIFYKWSNDEIKKNSRLIIRPGQDAVFLHNGRVEGIFEDDGSYDIDTEIIPFLSTLKGFKFGLNSGLRAEVLFINTKEFQMKWGTVNPVLIKTPELPGGMPIRANGTCNFKVSDYMTLITKLAGIKSSYTVEDVRTIIMSKINQLLMKWISTEGKDMFNLQANSYDIAKGIQNDLGYELDSYGFKITQFNIMSFNYPEEVQKMAEKAASQYMIGDMNKYTQMAMADGMANGNSGANMAASMMQMQMGMQMGQQMMQNMGMNNSHKANQFVPSEYPKFCPGCGKPTDGSKFCGGCGKQLAP